MWALAPGTCPLVATSNPLFATNPIRQTLPRATGTATEVLTQSRLRLKTRMAIINGIKTVQIIMNSRHELSGSNVYYLCSSKASTFSTADKSIVARRMPSSKSAAGPIRLTTIRFRSPIP